MKKPWLAFALITTVFWGIWGAFAEFPTHYGFPDTLIYVVWALTMLPPAAYALARVGWRIDRGGRAVFLGLLIGLTGAGGQMLLFHAVKSGPTYLIFPVIALSPVVTIAMSMVFLRERVSRLGAVGVLLALVSLPLFNLSGADTPFRPAALGGLWFLDALVILLAWGVQGYFMKLANNVMSAESIFFYMTVSGLLLVPVAIGMTDFAVPIAWGWNGPGLAAVTQILNAVGALTIVYAFRFGRALVVAPLTNAVSPLITSLVSMAVLSVIPDRTTAIGIGFAVMAAALLAVEPEPAA